MKTPIIAFVLSVASTAVAQEPAANLVPADGVEYQFQRTGRSAFTATYSTAIMVGDSYEFVDDFSYNGFELGVRWFWRNDMSVGITSGWQYADDKTRRTLERENVAFTSTQIRSVEAIPIHATVHGYYDLIPGDLAAFAGLGVGAYWTERQTDVGVLVVRNDGWAFGLAPELGLMLRLEYTHLILSTRFNWSAGGGDDLAGEKFFDFRIGIASF